MDKVLTTIANYYRQCYNKLLTKLDKEIIMVASMTGYGRAGQVANGIEATVQIKSVNHRYFEFSSRIPRAYNYLEDKMKKLVSDSVSRGKIEVSLTVYTTEGTDAQVEVNLNLAKGYTDALREAKDELGLSDDLALSHITRFNDIFNIKSVEQDAEVIWNNIKPIVSEAINNFVEMKNVEGEKMKIDVLSRIKTIEYSVAEIEKLSPETLNNYRERLRSKMQDVLNSTTIDESRILTEVAIFSEKIAVDEETVRLRSHLEQVVKLLSGNERAVGRKLDFIVQEMNREINTIGSKAQEIAITNIVVDVKSELEKIREQIQNIE